MNAKLLDLSEPLIRGYLHHAYPLSILANNDKYLPWFHCQYLQLTCTSEFDNHTPFQLDFFSEHEYLYNFPYIKTSFIHTNFLRHLAKDIISFIISSIDSDYYVYTHVDEFYIPMSPDYQKRHFTHNILVSGYNELTQELTITGFNHQLRFSSYSISFKMFTHAFNNATFPETYLLKYDETHRIPTFRLDVITRYLEDYINAKNSFIQSTRWNRFTNYDRYGIDVYEYLKRYIKHSYQNKAAPSFILFHILWEHKKSMKDTIVYLNSLYKDEFNIYVNEFYELEQRCKMLKHLIIKCNIHYQVEIIDHCLLALNYVIDVESKLIEKVVKKINSLHHERGKNYKFQTIL